MANRYDHVKEAKSHYANASELRRKAYAIRTAAEQQAVELEQAAHREVERGLHVHRLCTAGSAPKCCRPPKVGGHI
jgi:hypothetical protein